jgi:predicted nucleic acid-binding protein
MTLVDTSIWIDRFRRADTRLRHLLVEDRVLTHPFVIGEIALGVLPKASPILGDLQRLPKVRIANDQEILHFISARKLSGLGIGLVNAHLLAAVILTPGARLWTRDKKLIAAAERTDTAAIIVGLRL